MAKFNGDSEQRLKAGDNAGSLFDSLVRAAGGESLGGWPGLVQAVFNAWSRTWPMPGSGWFRYLVWMLQQLLNTIGLVRAFRSRDEQVVETAENPAVAFLASLGVVVPRDLEKVPVMVHVYAALGKLHVADMTFPRPNGEPHRSQVRHFRMADLDFYFLFMSYDEREDALTSQSLMASGPYLRPDQSERFLDLFSELIWSTEGASDLELTTPIDRWGGRGNVFSIENIGHPGDYVDGGEVLQSLEAVAYRCRRFQEKRMGRNILFFGPPGTGKSSLARNLARAVSGSHTLRIDPEVLKHAGTERTMGFAKLLRPKVILFDDIDRDRGATEQLLHYLEGRETWLRGVIVIGTVNAIRELDPALLRPGRFDEVRLVEPPGVEHRRAILIHYIARFAVSGLDLEAMVADTEGMTPAELLEIVQCVSAVGTGFLKTEIERVNLQRGLYADDRVAEYLRGG